MADLFPPAMRFGIFIAPFHPVDENPDLALRRDFELVEWLDQLGYDEAWIGEHHSAGYEIIASPELFIAAAAERTKHIKLGTGVSSLPYHHPLMLADRINQLDHQTRGRTIFGVGPGALPSDAFMMGIDVLKQRDMMDEAIGVLVPLLRGETVTHKSDWFELRDARLQLAPFTRPHIEICVASQVSPAGARAAGKHGVGLLSIGATSTGGFNALAMNWQICSDRATEFGHEAQRNAWRLVGPMHIAETKEKARENVRFGLANWLEVLPGGRGAAAGAGRLDRQRDRRAGRLGPRRDRRSATTRSPSSSGSRSNRAASAASCTWRTTGPTSRRPSAATSSSPAT